MYCHPAYLTYIHGTSGEMSDWMEHRVETRLPGEISVTTDMQMIPPLWQKVKKTKEPLDESEIVGLKLNIQKTMNTASSPITSWQIDGETVEAVIDFILGGSRDITSPAKVHLVKAMFFPIVRHLCESRTIKKAEHQGRDAFEMWCWKRLKNPLDCKEIQLVHPKGNQS